MPKLLYKYDNYRMVGNAGFTVDLLQRKRKLYLEFVG